MTVLQVTYHKILSRSIHLQNSGGYDVYRLDVDHVNSLSSHPADTWDSWHSFDPFLPGWPVSRTRTLRFAASSVNWTIGWSRWWPRPKCSLHWPRASTTKVTAAVPWCLYIVLWRRIVARAWTWPVRSITIRYRALWTWRPYHWARLGTLVQRVSASRFNNASQTNEIFGG